MASQDIKLLLCMDVFILLNMLSRLQSPVLLLVPPDMLTLWGQDIPPGHSVDQTQPSGRSTGPRKARSLRRRRGSI